MGELIRLKNGAMQDPATGRIVANDLDSDTARQMANKRWERARQAVKDALMAHPDAATDTQGLQMIAEAQVELASSPEAGSPATRAAQFIWEKGGYDSPTQRVSQPSISIEIRSERVAEALAERIRDSSRLSEDE